jgi:endonuclease/exonuclease/phosphatase family metal-dependent hydrolase
VVSYNIQNAKRVPDAIEVLSASNLDNADVICLQEMDFRGVARVAESFAMNYVYYPAAIHRGNDFGNAILSRWPLSDDQKTILPHKNTDRTHRIAVSSHVRIGDQNLLIFSVHLGVTIGRRQRFEQLMTILNSVPDHSQKIIIAGDFNTLTSSHTRVVHKPFKERNFRHATTNVPWTYSHWYLWNKKAVLDYIFVAGLKPLSSGQIDDHTASDHLPIWVNLHL